MSKKKINIHTAYNQDEHITSEPMKINGTDEHINKSLLEEIIKVSYDIIGCALNGNYAKLKKDFSRYNKITQELVNVENIDVTNNILYEMQQLIEIEESENIESFDNYTDRNNIISEFSKLIVSCCDFMENNDKTLSREVIHSIAYCNLFTGG